MTRYLRDVPEVKAGLDILLSHDPVFSTMNIDRSGLCWEKRAPGFEGLLRIILGQQVSTGAADAMWARMVDVIAEPTAQDFITLSDEQLRAIGFSGQKINYARGLSHSILDGEFDPTALNGLSDDAVTEKITAHKGLGPWSAHMFLMFCLGRPDLWPVGDLGIQIGVQKYHDLPERPTPQQTEELGQKWAPHRTAASLLCWHLKAL